jgi:uncharacterized repeat protein (TIGR03987 family)
MNDTATIAITAALVFYSVGVWSERIAGKLKVWHLIFFWLGLICDTWGTGLMFDMAGGMTFDVHGLTGLSGSSPISARCFLRLTNFKWM